MKLFVVERRRNEIRIYLKLSNTQLESFSLLVTIDRPRLFFWSHD